MKRISSLPVSLRPREKILRLGGQALTLEELLAAVLVTGTKQESITALAGKLAAYLKKKKSISQATLLGFKLGPSKVAQLLAVQELAKRLQKDTLVTLVSAREVVAQSYEIRDQQKESLLCFYLNARGELLKKELLAVGSLNRAHLLPREIFQCIKDIPLASVILVHNHPSGILEASRDDILFTKRVKRAADILGVAFLDHLIVTKAGWMRIKI